MKAIFDLKAGSGYDDEILSRYQFPDRSDYLAAARGAVGDWIIYREGQREGGRRAYVAAARVMSVVPDSDRAKHHIARVTDFLEFPAPVPIKTAGRYAEAPMRAVGDPRRVGQTIQGKSVRALAQEDFDAIVLAGLGPTLAPENRIRLNLDVDDPEFPLPEPVGAPDIPGVFENFERRVELMLVNRKIRDANFRLEVCRAYGDTCAVTGLKIINGGGRSEVQAAHIRPVSDGGPDVVINGLALSATVHWLFDRHLISIDPNYRLLVSHNRVPGELRNLFRPENEGLHLPNDRRLWPHPAFLEHHRERFAGAR